MHGYQQVLAVGSSSLQVMIRSVGQHHVHQPAYKSLYFFFSALLLIILPCIVFSTHVNVNSWSYDSAIIKFARWEQWS